MDSNQIPRKTNFTLQGLFVECKRPWPDHPIPSHTWGDCFNNPKKKTLKGQIDNNQHDKHHGKGHFYSTRRQGCGQGCGYHFIMLLIFLTPPPPTLHIKQATRNAPMDAISMVSNTNNSNMSNNQTHLVKHISKPNRGEESSWRLYNNVINCESVHIKDITCCETANNVINTARLVLPYWSSYSHHFNFLWLQYLQDENITGHLLHKTILYMYLILNVSKKLIPSHPPSNSTTQYHDRLRDSPGI